MRKKKIIISCGEILWDIFPDITVLGGAPFNFINRINNLGDISIFISRIGNDQNGKNALQQLKSLGLSDQFIQIDKHKPTGTVSITLDEENNADYTIHEQVAYDFIEPDRNIDLLLEQCDCFYYGTLIQRNEKSNDTLYYYLNNCSCLKFYDINLRKDCYQKSSIVRSLFCADIVKLNDQEVKVLIELLGYPPLTCLDFCNRLCADFSISQVLVTFAAFGAFVYQSERESFYTPGYKVVVKDTVGAGDAFAAGFIHSFLHDNKIKQALDYANKLGAIVATQNGGTCPVSAKDFSQISASFSEINSIPDLMQHLF